MLALPTGGNARPRPVLPSGGSRAGTNSSTCIIAGGGGSHGATRATSEGGGGARRAAAALRSGDGAAAAAAAVVRLPCVRGDGCPRKRRSSSCRRRTASSAATEGRASILEGLVSGCCPGPGDAERDDTWWVAVMVLRGATRGSSCVCRVRLRLGHGARVAAPRAMWSPWSPRCRGRRRQRSRGKSVEARRPIAVEVSESNKASTISMDGTLKPMLRRPRRIPVFDPVRQHQVAEELLGAHCLRRHVTQHPAEKLVKRYLTDESASNSSKQRRTQRLVHVAWVKCKPNSSRSSSPLPFVSLAEKNTHDRVSSCDSSPRRADVLCADLHECGVAWRSAAAW